MSGTGINPGQKVIALNVGSSAPNGFTNDGWSYNQTWNSNWSNNPFFQQNGGSFAYGPFPYGPNTSNNTGTDQYGTSNSGSTASSTGANYVGSQGNTGSSSSTSYGNDGSSWNNNPSSTTGYNNPSNTTGFNNPYPNSGYGPNFGNTYGGGYNNTPYSAAPGGWNNSYNGIPANWNNTPGWNGYTGTPYGGSNFTGNSRHNNVTPLAILTSIGINPDAPINTQQFFTTLFNQFGINTAGTFTAGFFSDYLNIASHENIAPKAILGLVGVNPFVAINPSNFFERILSHFGNPQVIFNPVTFTSQYTNLIGSWTNTNNGFTNNYANTNAYYPQFSNSGYYPTSATNNAYSTNNAESTLGINEVIVGEVVEATENGFWVQGKTFYAVNFDGSLKYVAQSQYTTVRFVASQGWEFLTTNSFPEFTNEFYTQILSSNSFQPNEIGVNLLGSIPELIQTAYNLTNTINSALASSDLQSRKSIEALSAKVSDFMKNANEELRKVSNSPRVPVHSA